MPCFKERPKRRNLRTKLSQPSCERRPSGKAEGKDMEFHSMLQQTLRNLSSLARHQGTGSIEWWNLRPPKSTNWLNSLARGSDGPGLTGWDAQKMSVSASGVAVSACPLALRARMPAPWRGRQPRWQAAMEFRQCRATNVSLASGACSLMQWATDI